MKSGPQEYTTDPGFSPNAALQGEENLTEVKNEAETLVRLEFSQRRKELAPDLNIVWATIKKLIGGRSSKHESYCLCPLCEVDMLALALSTLPPLYCTKDNYGLMKKKTNTVEINSTIHRSMEKVRRHPKHRLTMAVTDNSTVTLVNFPFEAAASLVKPILSKIEHSCACPSCVADTLALALNRYQPKYGVSYKGHTRLPLAQMEFIRHEVEIALQRAARKVVNHPHHK